MRQIECRKVENCFAGNHIYEYRLSVRLIEAFILALGAVGTLTFHRNFPRPFFKVVLADGATVKGVLNDTVMKVQYPDDDPKTSKAQFETILEELLERQSKEME